MIHPHLQVVASDWPYSLITNLLEHSQRYYAQHSTCYWEDLVETEKRLGERYIGRLGNTEWLVPFAPAKEDEVHGLVRNKSNLLEFDDSDWESLGGGISRGLKCYNDQGYSSCNFALYSGRLNEELDYLWAGVRIGYRTNVGVQNVTDIWYGQYLLDDKFVYRTPEDVAELVRNYF